jgi:integrase/recombinase XerD
LALNGTDAGKPEAGKTEMIGCRPLTDDEVDKIAASFVGSAAFRSRCAFLVGRYTGERVSAVLSLKVGDVIDENGTVRDQVRFKRSTRKGGKRKNSSATSRIVKLHQKAKDAIILWIEAHPRPAWIRPDQPLFLSREYTQLSRYQFHRDLKRATECARVDSQLVASHSMRKTFASVMLKTLDGSIYKLQAALGHKSLSSTVSYISFSEKEVDDAILAQ